jgi:hypothetical protein
MGEILDAPNQQVVRPDESAPWEEGEGGSEHPEAGHPEGGATADLRSHAGLDSLAAERGHTWSSDDLTVAEKRDELGV